METGKCPALLVTAGAMVNPFLRGIDMSSIPNSSSTLSLFDGKVCTRCKTWQPFSLFKKKAKYIDGVSWCRSCEAAASREYHAKHAEEIRVKAVARYYDNHDANLRYMEQYRKGKRREWYERNIEKMREYDRKRRLSHREKERHRGCMRYFERCKRMKKNGGSHTLEQWQELCARYDFRCLKCGEKKPLSADHIIPVSRGGTNDISNLQPLCRPCNTSKGAKTIDYRPKE
jgi:5-methylcytosine-specific restriction endonuclease McrA